MTFEGVEDVQFVLQTMDDPKYKISQVLLKEFMRMWKTIHTPTVL